MANQEQLEILKQGVDVWNKWRRDNLTTHIDLRRINLNGANLEGADLRLVDLNDANLNEANLSEALLTEANLEGADLEEADLRGADLSGAILSYADLSYSVLNFTNLRGAILDETDFNAVSIAQTIFAFIDLSEANELDSVEHDSESTLGTDTLALSKGRIPEAFLRGCGLSDWEIEVAKLYNPELDNEERNQILYKIYDLQANQAVQISPLFISYSHADDDFVDRMEKSLNTKGVRFWRDVHDATVGRLEKQIDRAIRRNPTVLLVLSKNSIQSDWVEHEVNLARELEKETKQDVLCPIALDESWKTSSWSKVIMRQVTKYNILDFSNWEDDEKFEKMFVRLIDGLNLFYKKEDE